MRREVIIATQREREVRDLSNFECERKNLLFYQGAEYERTETVVQ